AKLVRQVADRAAAQREGEIGRRGLADEALDRGERVRRGREPVAPLDRAVPADAQLHARGAAEERRRMLGVGHLEEEGPGLGGEATSAWARPRSSSRRASSSPSTTWSSAPTR